MPPRSYVCCTVSVVHHFQSAKVRAFIAATHDAEAAILREHAALGRTAAVEGDAADAAAEVAEAAVAASRLPPGRHGTMTRGHTGHVHEHTAAGTGTSTSRPSRPAVVVAHAAHGPRVPPPSHHDAPLSAYAASSAGLAVAAGSRGRPLQPLSPGRALGPASQLSGPRDATSPGATAGLKAARAAAEAAAAATAAAQSARQLPVAQHVPASGISISALGAASGAGGHGVGRDLHSRHHDGRGHAVHHDDDSAYDSEGFEEAE